jgi:hypothetical protein
MDANAAHRKRTLGQTRSPVSQSAPEPSATVCLSRTGRRATQRPMTAGRRPPEGPCTNRSWYFRGQRRPRARRDREIETRRSGGERKVSPFATLRAYPSLAGNIARPEERGTLGCPGILPRASESNLGSRIDATDESARRATSPFFRTRWGADLSACRPRHRLNRVLERAVATKGRRRKPRASRASRAAVG